MASYHIHLTYTTNTPSIYINVCRCLRRTRKSTPYIHPVNPSTYPPPPHHHHHHTHPPCINVCRCLRRHDVRGNRGAIPWGVREEGEGQAGLSVSPRWELWSISDGTWLLVETPSHPRHLTSPTTITTILPPPSQGRVILMWSLD